MAAVCCASTSRSAIRLRSGVIRTRSSRSWRRRGRRRARGGRRRRWRAALRVSRAISASAAASALVSRPSLPLPAAPVDVDAGFGDDLAHRQAPGARGPPARLARPVRLAPRARPARARRRSRRGRRWRGGRRGGRCGGRRAATPSASAITADHGADRDGLARRRRGSRPARPAGAGKTSTVTLSVSSSTSGSSRCDRVARPP